MNEALAPTKRTTQTFEWTVSPDNVKPQWRAIRSVRSWKITALVDHDPIKANKKATRISDRVNHLVFQRKSISIKIRLDDDQELGNTLKENGLLTLFEIRKFEKKGKYFGTVELKMIPGSGDYQPMIEALKPTSSENLVVQFSANAYPCKSFEFQLQPASVVSIKYLKDST